MMPGNKKLFLSAVSSDFVSHRSLLAADLKRPDLDVAVQEISYATDWGHIWTLEISITPRAVLSVPPDAARGPVDFRPAQRASARAGRY